MSDWGYYGPCMCGGCRRCLHDQGYDCGDPNCKHCAWIRDELEEEEEKDYGEEEDA